MNCVHHLVHVKLNVSPAFKAFQKIGDENFFPGLSRKVVTGSMKILVKRLFS